MPEYDNDRQVILSKVVSDHPKAPPLRVRLELNGEKYEAGLWPMQRRDGTTVHDKNGNMLYKGKLEVDTYQKSVQEQPKAQDFDDEDVPF